MVEGLFPLGDLHLINPLIEWTTPLKSVIKTSPIISLPWETNTPLEDNCVNLILVHPKLERYTAFDAELLPVLSPTKPSLKETDTSEEDWLLDFIEKFKFSQYKSVKKKKIMVKDINLRYLSWIVFII